jgi:DNA-binding transcriptional MocR family regulator
MFDRLLQEQICVTPGALYSLSERYNHALRLSCCYPFDARYSRAIQRAGEIACELAGIPCGEAQGVPLRPQTV